MRIRCPACGIPYSVPQSKIRGRTMTAVCKKCGTGLTIEAGSGAVKLVPGPAAAHPETAEREKVSGKTTSLSGEPPVAVEKPRGEPDSPQVLPSVASMAPLYPKSRDALIIACVIFVFIAMGAAGYVLVGGAQRSFLEWAGRPVASFFSLLTGTGTFDVCEAFLRRNQNRFPQLGGNITYVPIRQEIRVYNGNKTATAIIGIQGSDGVLRVHFRLRFKEGIWRVIGVMLERGDGQLEDLYPGIEQGGYRGKWESKV